MRIIKTLLKMIKQMKLITTLFMLVSVASNAQSPLTPSNKAFQKKWLHSKNYQMIWYGLKDTAKIEIGKVKTSITTDGKLLTVVTEVQMRGMNTSWIDTSVAEMNTLQPVKHSSYNMQRDMVLYFGKVVTGFYNDKMKKNNVAIRDTTVGGYFDSNLYPLLLGLLPLKEGYSREIVIYDYNPAGKKGIMKAIVKSVVSGSFVTQHNGIRDVWIVTTTDEISNSLTTYYFDKIDRKLWKQEMDAKGRKMVMFLDEK
jgi:hypothetical protein